MSDYLDEVHGNLRGARHEVFGDQRGPHYVAANAYALASIANSLDGLLAEFREVFAITPDGGASGEFVCGCGETVTPEHSHPADLPSLAVLDRTEQEAQTLAALRDFLFIDWRDYDTDEWQRALDRVRHTGRPLFGLAEIGGAS
jgi:hypothetical protein